MANNKVKFLRGTANEYANATKDSDTIYFITDSNKLYIGDKEIIGENITIDDILSDTSTNSLQNKVIKAELDKKANKEIYTDSGISLGRDPDTDLGTKSTAIGDYVTATGATSVAIGNQTVATGSHTTAIGNFTTASGDKSVAMGDSTTAQGFNSLAGGLESKAVGNNSIAFGYGIETNKNNSAAFGEFNQSDDNTLFSIGDGDSSDDRHNAFEITKTGGKLHDKDIATTDLATNSTDGLMSAADKVKLDSGIATKLNASSYREIIISTSDWEGYANISDSTSSGGFKCTKTLDTAMPFENFNFEVKLSTDDAAAKLQIQNWNYIMVDGRIAQTTDESGNTTAFTFYAFTTQPTVELTISIQGVSGE